MRGRFGIGSDKIGSCTVGRGGSPRRSRSSLKLGIRGGFGIGSSSSGIEIRGSGGSPGRSRSRLKLGIFGILKSGSDSCGIRTVGSEKLQGTSCIRYLPMASTGNSGIGVDSVLGVPVSGPIIKACPGFMPGKCTVPFM
jgi:hypothetical protein